MSALTPTEIDLLAIRLAVHHLAVECPASDWLHWDELMYLTEADFDAVAASITNTVPNLLRGLLSQGERIHDIDSALLLERAKHGEGTDR